MERVKKGEKYWYVHLGDFNPCTMWDWEDGSIYAEGRYNNHNYFHTEEGAENAVRKIEAVLNGAEVIETPGEEIVINNKLDPVTILYHNGTEIGKIENGAAMDDVLAQIRTKKDNGEDTSGYYLMWGEQKIEILPSGKIPSPPEGLYDSSAKSLSIIFGI